MYAGAIYPGLYWPGPGSLVLELTAGLEVQFFLGIPAVYYGPARPPPGLTQVDWGGPPFIHTVDAEFQEVTASDAEALPLHASEGGDFIDRLTEGEPLPIRSAEGPEQLIRVPETEPLPSRTYKGDLTVRTDEGKPIDERTVEENPDERTVTHHADVD